MRLIQIAALVLIFLSHSVSPCQAVTHTNSEGEEDTYTPPEKKRLSAKRRKKALEKRADIYLYHFPKINK